MARCRSGEKRSRKGASKSIIKFLCSWEKETEILSWTFFQHLKVNTIWIKMEYKALSL